MCSDDFYERLLIGIVVVVAAGIFGLGFLAGALIF